MVLQQRTKFKSRISGMCLCRSFSSYISISFPVFQKDKLSIHRDPDQDKTVAKETVFSGHCLRDIFHIYCVCICGFPLGTLISNQAELPIESK